MTLLELCEPLCQYVCRLNRSARKGGHSDHTQVMADIEGLFNEMLAKGMSDPVLAAHLDKDKGKMELVLAFFVDFMIRESKLPFAGQWKDIAVERYNELSGDEKFWDLLETTLAERGEAADERISLFYSLIGLGFTGWYTGQPEYLRKKMMECSARLRGMIDADEKSTIIAESELYPNTADLIEPPGKSLVGIGIASVVLLIVLFLGNIYLYSRGTAELDGALSGIADLQTASPAATDSSTDEPTASGD